MSSKLFPDIIDIHVIVDENSKVDKCRNLLFEIYNNGLDLHIKRTYIIPVEPKNARMQIENFILLIKSGKSIERLKLGWGKSTDTIDFNKIQFQFITSDGEIDTNIIDVG